MTTADFATGAASSANVIELSARRDPLDAFDVTLRRLQACVDAQAARPVRCEADEAAWGASRQPDRAATTKARRKARKLLSAQLPAVADELLRLSNVVRDGHAALDDKAALAAIAGAFKRMINGCLSGDDLDDMILAVALVRETTFVARNGDYV